ncbi:transglycosylase domain-containing protein [Corynebacterium breve]|uniref:Transglycosylase domain-containing protein n=1 Tax=Corynebacterium breve TaxID=3049799 RepID=A0ABY8VGN3_9CORY|nr:transglycosylase domain-containing protein [Corynebacterium breve]WIM67930.1 transglycosylase domain-containing protein [Corynebacterium breve]
MSSLKSLRNLAGAVVASGVLIALSLTPIAGIGGAAVARTNETMQSNLSDLTDGTAPGVTTITDVNGEPMAWLYNQNRFEVAPEEISQHAKDALVAIEDRRFYEHDGVDLQGTFRALLANVAAGGVEQGASTINQQYVKNYLLHVDAKSTDEQIAATEQSVPRKLREMRMASDLDKNLSKDEILGRYLNVVPFGNHAYGIEAAARTYYGVSAAELTVPQSALLVGIVQSSEALNPYYNEEGATERRNTVLQAMVSSGYLDQASADAFKAEPLGVLESPDVLPNGCISAGNKGFMCDYAVNYLEAKGISKEQLQNDSYTVRTTLDPVMQDAAYTAVTTAVDPNAAGVAGVLNVVEPGEDSRNIRAMVSSRNYGLNLDAGETYLPQPSSLVGNGAGSIFKLFTAAAAVEQGMGLDTLVNVPARVEVSGMGAGGAKNCPPGKYCVENVGTFEPQLTLRDALAKSPNTPFIELIERVGVEAVVDMSVRLGLRSYTTPGSYNGDASIADYFKQGNMGSYTLGPTAVNALELSNVGATLASSGRWCEPNPIESITDRDGQEVFLERPECEQALDPGVANAVASGLSADTTIGTASRAAGMFGWGAPVAAKTGTTESHQSSAFLGYNTAFAAAPYIFNDGTVTSSLCTSPVRQCGDGSLYGGREPAEIWFRTAVNVPGVAGAPLPSHDARYDGGTNQELVAGIVGLSEDNARKQLEEKGFTVSTVKVAGNGIPAGHVVSVSPQDPTMAEGSEIVLNVSDGTTSRPAPAAPAPAIPDAPGAPAAPAGEPAPPAIPEIDTEELERLINDSLNELLNQ